jgi:hypothetical protein
MPTPQQYKKLRDALISAFPLKSSLEQLLFFELGRNLNQITQDSNLQTVVFQLIQTAESQGWLIELVKAARKENPGNSELKAIALELLPKESSSVPKQSSSSSATVAKPSTQQRKTLVLPAYVVVFVLIAGGTIVWMWNKKTDNNLSQPEPSTTQTFQPTATPGGTHSTVTTPPSFITATPRYYYTPAATTPPTVTPPSPTNAPTSTNRCHIDPNWTPRSIVERDWGTPPLCPPESQPHSTLTP